MNELFACDDIGEVNKYVGCKVTRSASSIKLTQPVLLQSYVDEFDLTQIRPPRTPSVPGSTLHKGNDEATLNGATLRTYRSGVGKLLHMTRWTRPDIMNSVRELSRFMTGALLAHMAAMHRVMAYCVATPNRGITLTPNEVWNGSADKIFKISGRADSDYAKDIEMRRSVNGWVVFLCGAVVNAKSKMMSVVALSVTEAELSAAVSCVQDMLFVKSILESLGLKVELPMIIEVDNKGGKDYIDSWSVGGRMRHIQTKFHFLRELKEQGIIAVKWISTDSNTADVFTKNLNGAGILKNT